jgi:hypothetical protein
MLFNTPKRSKSDVPGRRSYKKHKLSQRVHASFQKSENKKGLEKLVDSIWSESGIGDSVAITMRLLSLTEENA